MHAVFKEEKMKKWMVLFSLVGTVFSFAQQLEPVYSIVKVRHEASWYEYQLNGWKKEVEKNNQNQEAWLNYYAAARALRFAAADENPKQYDEIRAKYTKVAEGIVAEAQKQVPNSWTAHYLTYSEKGLDGGGEALMKAAAIDDKNPIIVDELMIHYELERNSTKRDEYAKRYFELNEMSPSSLNWAYNLLSELDDNAIVFTCGDLDTYSLWVIQGAKEFRTDVTVINTSMFTLDDYRIRLFKEMNVTAPTHQAASTSEQQWANKFADFDALFQSKRPTYVSTSAIAEFEEHYADQLYLTGLAYKFSKTPFDNVAIIRRNYEKRYLLDYLKQVFTSNEAEETGKQFNGLYLPSLMKLYQHYNESEELFRKQEVEEWMKVVAEESGQQEEVIQLFAQSNYSPNFLSAVLDIKSLEKSFAPLRGSVYIAKNEMTNGEYRKFLNNVLQSKHFDLYKIVRPDSLAWAAKFPGSASFSDPMKDMYGWHPAYDNYPVVNISHEAAVKYCEWLTKQYNLQRKRTYTQVVFRLPTELEWRTAAGSGNPQAITPFPQDNIKNCDSCYLGNIKTGPQRFFDDGAFHQAKVGTYNPNNLGCYNTLGNVSEMLDKPGVAIGGSWNDLYEACFFNKKQAFNGPDPTVGFRIIMEIIEE